MRLAWEKKRQKDLEEFRKTEEFKSRSARKFLNITMIDAKSLYNRLQCETISDLV